MNEIEYKHLYTSDEKLKWWGYGQWVEESDEIIFNFQGIDCRIIRVTSPEQFDTDDVFGGHFCGYCKIPENHSFYHKQYDEIDIEVHMGLTYSEQKEDGYWIGFDCAHSCDICPSTEKFMIQSRMNLIKKFPHLERSPVFKTSYKNVSFCIEQCKSMAEQIKNYNECLTKKQ